MDTSSLALAGGFFTTSSPGRPSTLPGDLKIMYMPQAPPTVLASPGRSPCGNIFLKFPLTLIGPLVKNHNYSIWRVVWLEGSLWTLPTWEIIIHHCILAPTLTTLPSQWLKNLPYWVSPLSPSPTRNKPNSTSQGLLLPYPSARNHPGDKL